MRGSKILKAAEGIALEGFAKTVEQKNYGLREKPNMVTCVRLESEEQKIRFEMEVYSTDGSDWERKEYGAVRIDGHTHFEIDGRGWVTFDRVGVDDSFHCGAGTDLRETLILQLSKIKASRTRAKTTSPLPSPLGSFHRTPEEVEELKKQLRLRGSIQFVPSGFGIGYSVRVTRSRFATPVPQLAKFFGYDGMLYLETMDCD